MITMISIITIVITIIIKIIIITIIITITIIIIIQSMSEVGKRGWINGVPARCP